MPDGLSQGAVLMTEHAEALRLSIAEAPSHASIVNSAGRLSHCITCSEWGDVQTAWLRFKGNGRTPWYREMLMAEHVQEDEPAHSRRSRVARWFGDGSRTQRIGTQVIFSRNSTR